MYIYILYYILHIYLYICYIYMFLYILEKIDNFSKIYTSN